MQKIAVVSVKENANSLGLSFRSELTLHIAIALLACQKVDHIFIFLDANGDKKKLCLRSKVESFLFSLRKSLQAKISLEPLELEGKGLIECESEKAFLRFVQTFNVKNLKVCISGENAQELEKRINLAVEQTAAEGKQIPLLFVKKGRW